MQSTDVPKNKVIIVGEDHHNGLGLARIFGLNRKKVIAVIISSKKRSWVAASKYVEKSFIFETEKEAFDYIRDAYSGEATKPFIFPCSDKIALELDLRLNEFKDNFYVSSIDCEQGKIASLMDKEAQYKWAEEHEINMAQSVVVSTDDDFQKISASIGYPLILKPVISAHGSKFDIRVCENDIQLKESLQLLKEKNYMSVLAQKYFSNRSEILLVGMISDDVVFSAHEVIRRWPETGGCGSFSQIVLDEQILHQCSMIMKKIAKYGFRGLIDVETFFVDGKIYLNEINWRNSGGCFRAINNGFYYAYWWYRSVLFHEVPPKWKPLKSYSMVEYADVHHVFKRNITVTKWLKNFINVNNFALINKKDIRPLFFKFLNRIM